MLNFFPENLSRARIGVSSCLLGAAVRFDGGHKRDPFLTDDLGRFVEWVPVCPEVEMGLGVPRETLRLVDGGSGPQLLSPTSRQNQTVAMRDWSQVMRRTPTRRNHTNVLQHLAGYFSRKLSSADRAELTDVIANYRLGLLPLIVPITFVRHYVRQQALTYLEEQVYLQPHPSDLRLLNTL